MAGRVTAIEVQKRNPRRANVFIEGAFAFGLAMIEAAKLSKGQYLSQEDIKAILELDQQECAYESALNFLSYRPRSRAETERRLRKKEFSEETIQAVTDRLCRAGLLDDEAFARYWIENREQFKPRGQYALRHELRQKGIDSSIVDALLEDLDETESAYRAATKQLARWKRLDPSVRRKRMVDHMRRRGFSYEIAQQVWERIVAEHGMDLDDIENGEDTTIWNGET